MPTRLGLGQFGFPPTPSQPTRCRRPSVAGLEVPPGGLVSDHGVGHTDGSDSLLKGTQALVLRQRAVESTRLAAA
eukprot:3200921-Amphidinium_carterae.1